MSRNTYLPKMEKRWYLGTPALRVYALREASSFFVGLWYLDLCVGIAALLKGVEAWSAWLSFQSNPLVMLFCLIGLALSLVHTKTWFDMTPRVMPPQIGKIKLNKQLLFWAHWVGFIVISLAIFVLFIWRVYS